MKALYVVLLCSLTTSFLATSVAAILCHVCDSASDNCTDTDLGEVKDGCESCGAYKMAANRFKRLCLGEVKDNLCELQRGRQACSCNTTLCNAEHIFKPVIRCYECEYSTGSDTGTCNDAMHVRQVDKCLTCYTSQTTGNKITRGCVKATMALGCTDEDGNRHCYCDEELCNGNHIDQLTVRCYVCKPVSDDDTSCNVVYTSSVQEGCLSCGRSVDENGKMTRFCMNQAPSNDTYDGNTVNYCKTDLCNGESETFGALRSRGQQKTVSGRVLIGGAVAAMLGLAQLF